MQPVTMDQQRLKRMAEIMAPLALEARQELCHLILDSQIEVMEMVLALDCGRETAPIGMEA